ARRESEVLRLDERLRVALGRRHARAVADAVGPRRRRLREDVRVGAIGRLSARDLGRAIRLRAHDELRVEPELEQDLHHVERDLEVEFRRHQALTTESELWRYRWISRRTFRYCFTGLLPPSQRVVFEIGPTVTLFSVIIPGFARSGRSSSVSARMDISD